MTEGIDHVTLSKNDEDGKKQLIFPDAEVCVNEQGNSHGLSLSSHAHNAKIQTLQIICMRVVGK